MTGFPRRPLALFVSCLFAVSQAGQVAAAQEQALRLALAADGTPPAVAESPVLLAANDPPVSLRVEKKFNILKRTKTPRLPLPAGMSVPVVEKQDDVYPMFLSADQIEGRTDDTMEASGDVELRRADMLLFADRLSYQPLQDVVDASGNVRLQQEESELRAPRLHMKMSEQIGFAEQVEFHLVKDTKSRLYRPQESLLAVQQVSSSSSGSPMTLYVPNSYGLPTVGPARRPAEATGKAERMDFEGENRFHLTDAVYSTCKPGEKDWYLQAESVDLDYDENKGRADNASLWFKDVPLFYAPMATFSLNNQRRSGFLHPTFSSTTRTGLDFTLPFYWNIAPDYDLTLFPRYLSKRGFQLGAGGRYQGYNYQGFQRLEYLADDALLHRERYAYSLLHTQDLGLGLSATINWNGVSDDTYWQDMTSRLMQTSSVQLQRQVGLLYAPSSWLQGSLEFQRFQTLQTDPANRVTVPYFVEPRISFLASRPDVLGADLTLLGQFSRFTHTDISKPQGDRLLFYPQVSFPFVFPAFQITPKFGLHMTRYSLDRQVAGQPMEISRTLPTFTLDASVFFERETSILGNAFVQTLEPRLYYVNIPYRNQSAIPLFDSGIADFNFAQIFSENRYSGFDRINDANQLTAALSSAFIDPNSGVERFRAMIGQRYYFRPQRVTIAGETSRTDDFSNLVAAATGLVAPKTYADAAWEYNYRNGNSERFSLGARYQPEYAKVVSASYRYTRDALNGSQQVDQIDLAGQWPLDARWFAVGRFNYSLRDSHPLESIAGIEYNAGCWAARFVAQRLEAISGSANTSIFFQLELNDFGSIGSNPLQLLRRSVPGYGKFNELPNYGQFADALNEPMHNIFRILSLVLFSSLLSTNTVYAAEPIEADRIVAVVGNEVITYYDLRDRLQTVVKQLQQQNTTLPPQDVLEQQMLERLIMDKAQLQLARETGLRVNDAELEQAIGRIAANNRLSLPQFKQTLEKDGVAWNRFREEIRNEMTVGRLRDREVDSKLVISDGEIDNFLANQKAGAGNGEEYQLAHILMRAPESASPEQLQKLRAKAEQALKRARAGETFSSLAAAFSDAPDALQGGNISWRPLDRLPPLYADAASRLQPGETSDILRSSAGFHILRLVAKRGGVEASVAVQQTHARHILVRINEVTSEAEARRKLENVRERIVNGVDFAEQARLYSQDGSAAKGGDLGWLNPGDTVPDFERAMDALKDNELSQVIQSPFGMHLIQVLERRQRDVSDERQRMQARQALRERKLDEAYQDWLRQLRDRTYVENRLQEQ